MRVQTDLTPVCCSDLGSYLGQDNFERWWRKFRAEHGLGDLIFHELRHTHATELITSNVDLKTVQRRLGHASFSTTMNIYAHAIPENDEEAARVIGDLHSMPEGEDEGDEPLTLVI